jgi:hypothetical protein
MRRACGPKQQAQQETQHKQAPPPPPPQPPFDVPAKEGGKEGGALSCGASWASHGPPSSRHCHTSPTHALLSKRTQAGKPCNPGAPPQERPIGGCASPLGTARWLRLPLARAPLARLLALRAW